MFLDHTEVSGDPTQRAPVAPGQVTPPSQSRRELSFAPSEVAEEPEFGAWGHDPHTHDFHQFLYSPLGHAHIQACQRTYRLSGTVGLWVPAEVVHAAWFSGDCLIQAIAFPVDLFALPHAACAEVAITAPIRRRLLAYLRERNDEVGPSSQLFETLVHGDLLPLPEPVSDVPRAVAHALAAAPQHRRTVEEWAAEFYTSPTSLRRAFQAETGVAFSEWRTRARLNASIELLARGQAVATVAQQVGFTSTNGFILAFRRHFATTPKAYAEARLLVG